MSADIVCSIPIYFFILSIRMKAHGVLGFWGFGVLGAQSKERKGSNFAVQRSGAIVLQAQMAVRIQSKKLAIAIWQP